MTTAIPGKIALLILITLTWRISFAQHNSPKHEFRGVWVASVANIDWPSKSGLTPDQQREEFRSIVKMHKGNGLNALIVQVRPSADAFYASRLEPWSRWLTGKLGRPPQPYYDPLEFMISEAHKNGLEFHAWFNPYRGIMNVDTSNIDSASVAFRHPSWFVKYDKHLYFNPGLPEARKHVTAVVMDVINRYDVDGIHFDDYFYPYKVANLSFPDSATFRLYGEGYSSIDDWRRSNVDNLIKDISDSIRQVKPFVKFGVSPFAVWRNQDKDPLGSATKAGQTCYDDLYADVLKWLREGWVDYVTPQIYWSIGFEVASYDVLATWWSRNSFGKPIYVGQAAYRVNGSTDSRWKEGDQLPKQLRLNRSLPNIQGSIFFSSRSFLPNPLGIVDSLKNNLYKYSALIPSVKKNATFNAQYALTATANNDGITLWWKETLPTKELCAHTQYVLYRFSAGENIDLNNSKKIIAILPNTNPYAQTTQWYTDRTAKKKKKYLYIVTGLSRDNIESKPIKAYPVKNFNKYWKTYEPVDL